MGLGGFAPNTSSRLVGLHSGGWGWGVSGKMRHVIPTADHLTTCPGLGKKSQSLISRNFVEIPPTGFGLHPFCSPFPSSCGEAPEPP